MNPIDTGSMFDSLLTTIEILVRENMEMRDRITDLEKAMTTILRSQALMLQTQDIHTKCLAKLAPKVTLVEPPNSGNKLPS